MSDARVVLPGSSRPPLPATGPGPDFDPSVPIEATVVLRRRAEPPANALTGPPRNRVELAESFGADPADVAALERAAAAAGVEVVVADPASRRFRLAGPAQSLATLFGTRLDTAELDGRVVRHRVGQLSVPAELGEAVVAVLGLDDRPQARAYVQHATAHATATSYTPPQLATIYGLPSEANGTQLDGHGQTVAIIELGGGYKPSDLEAYFKGLGLATPTVTSVGVDGGSNGNGTDPNGADAEVLLDIEVVGGIVPGADIVVYFAPNTDAGFLDAVSTAAHASPTPAAISISWGGSEDTWTAQARGAMDQAFADAALLGVTVTAAAGDNGSSDTAPASSSAVEPAAKKHRRQTGAAAGSAVHVDFPAASPNALACGGTSLRADAATGKVSSETVWNDGSSGGATGGGVSDTFPVPAYQHSVGVPDRSGSTGSGATGRGVPDVAGNADPQTGYQVLVDGQATVVGGTSAVAPLWAGAVCRLVQAAGKSFGLLQPKLYQGVAAGAAAPGLRDITSGNNGAYSAGPGWDACTGLGVPDGAALFALLEK